MWVRCCDEWRLSPVRKRGKFCVNCAVANLGIGMGVFLLRSDTSDLGGCVRLGGGLATITFD